MKSDNIPTLEIVDESEFDILKEEKLNSEQKEFLKAVTQIVNAYEFELDKIDISDLKSFDELYYKCSSKLQEFICNEIYDNSPLGVLMLKISKDETLISKYGKDSISKISYKAINKIVDFYNISLEKILRKCYKEKYRITSFDKTILNTSLNKKYYVKKYLEETIANVIRLSDSELISPKGLKTCYKIRNLKYIERLANILNSKSCTLLLILNDNLEIYKKSIDSILFAIEIFDVGIFTKNRQMFVALSDFILSCFESIDEYIEIGKISEALERYFIIVSNYYGIPKLEEFEITRLIRSISLIPKIDEYEKESKTLSCLALLKEILSIDSKKSERDIINKYVNMAKEFILDSANDICQDLEK